MPRARREPRARRLILVVTLTVRRAKLATFRGFERRAARVMARHGGAIERAVVIPPAGPGDLLREVHVVTFPDRAALAAYRQDAELLAAGRLREASVADTHVLIGTDGPDYTARRRGRPRSARAPRR
jgi:hypothetical protein